MSSRRLILGACVIASGGAVLLAAPTGSLRWTEASTGMEFIRVEPGRFVMGSPVDEVGREAQETAHQITLSRPYWLGAFEVTQRQWKLVMNENPSRFRAADGGALPVEEVTWFEVQEFLQRLTKRGNGSRFRLPTEAEWEYACRAGTTTAYGTGPVLTRAQANFTESATGGDGHTTTVGSFPPNAWGFHDMHGNVWEWTQDEHCPYGHAPATDPAPVCHGPLKVIRGGSWYFGADSARCALRYTHRPQDRGFSLGFRVVRDQLADHP